MRIPSWHMTCTYFSRRALLIGNPVRQGLAKGRGASSPWGSPARSYPRETGKMGCGCELKNAGVETYEHEPRQDLGRCSRRGGESSPREFSEDRASRFVVVGGSGDHRIATDNCAGVLSAPRS